MTKEPSQRTAVTVQDSVIEAGDTFRASIAVLDTGARFQEFFVVGTYDTVRLPTTEYGKVGLIEVSTREAGLRSIIGFTRIEYQPLDSVVRDPFQVHFTVK